jgi:thiamine biosynthesis protein ThiI
VNLRDADLDIHVEIRAKRAFVWYERIPGPGGLPSGVSGRILVLLSGGIDSPVAAYQFMKRGCNVDFVTFHSAPYTPPELIAKIGRLVRILNTYQISGRLVAVNLLPAQTAIRDRCREPLRTVLYRRVMARLAAVISRSLGAAALGTGDSLGQVASQTMENLTVVSDACPQPVFRPLLTFDKCEIVALAHRIGTLAVSQRNVPDSCTVFAPANPATAATLEQVRTEEMRLDLPALLRECLRQAVAVNPETTAQSAMPELATALEACLPALVSPTGVAAAGAG